MRRFLALVVVVVAAGGLASCKSSRKDDQLLRELADLDKQTIFDRGQELYDAGKYKEARELFSFVYDTFPNDPLGHEAALRVADTYAQKKDITSLTEARLRYKDFANRYPNDPDRDYALLMLGQTYVAKNPRPNRDLTPLLESLDAYQQLVNLYPESPYVAQAREQMAEVKEILAEHEWIVARFYARNGRWLAVRGRLEYLKEHYPEYTGMEQVDETLARAREEIEKFQAMIDKLQEETQDEEGAEDGEAPETTGR